MITRRDLFKGMLALLPAVPLAMIGKEEKPEEIHADFVTDSVFNGPVTFMKDKTILRNSIINGPVTIKGNQALVSDNFIQVRPSETAVTIGDISFGYGCTLTGKV